MYVIIWQYQVLAEHVSAFEQRYGDHGDWYRLFRRDPAYKGTRLLQDSASHDGYLTIDYWDSREAYEHFLQHHAEAYAALDRECEPLTAQEIPLGRFIYPV